MAVVQGIKEKVHLPIYDSLKVKPEEQLGDVESTSILKFFVNVQGKTKLETNLQAASLLPHYNTFEARAMRVVFSDLPPEFSDKVEGEAKDVDVTDGDGKRIDSGGKKEGEIGFDPTKTVVADFELDLKRLMELLKEARDNDEATLDIEDDFTLKLKVGGAKLSDTQRADVLKAGGTLLLDVTDLEEFIQDIENNGSPPLEQIRPDDGAGTIIGRFIYNTVTSLFVGEKEMIKMPTWFFPAGAGLFTSGNRFTTHGEPDPMATFRFAEPIFIDKQQNFRVEIEVPDSDTLKEIKKIYGPLFIWVVLDGYMTRDVQ